MKSNTITMEAPSTDHATNIDKEVDVNLTIKVEETCISESTLLNADDSNFLRKVESVESDMSCNSNESNVESIPLNSKSSPQGVETGQQTRQSNMLQEKSKQNKLYECTKCDATYDKYKSFIIHRNIHTNKYVCSYCGKAMGTSYGVKRHERAHTGELPYPCGKCDKRFRSNILLQQHQSTHTQARPFKCELCESTYKTKSALGRHLQMHTGIKQHKCTVCNARFMLMFNLKRHLQTHGKEADKGQMEK